MLHSSAVFTEDAILTVFFEGENVYFGVHYEPHFSQFQLYVEAIENIQ